METLADGTESVRAVARRSDSPRIAGIQQLCPPPERLWTYEV
jgi:hypothetical protein